MAATIYSKWGTPLGDEHQEAHREFANRFAGPNDDASPHGMTPSQIASLDDRGQRILKESQAWWGKDGGSVFSRSGSNVRSQLLQQALPPGRTPDIMQRRQGQLFGGSGGGSMMGGGNGSSVFTNMQPYQPEFASPDRQMFPIHRRIANTYWRLFNKMDPTIASVIELFAQLPWGDFQLTGEGVDGEIKEAFEYMINETKLRTLLPQFVSEFLVLGEVFPHLFFDDDKGIWTHIALHNPDQVNVVYSPFIKMDTIMEFVPDPKLRELVTSNHPMLARVRETMPPELVAHLRAGQNIPLSPVNATFIARKLHPYDLRGTSVMSRLWRTLMLEDAIWSATIQTARRAATPLKVVKLGDPTSGVIPPPSEEKKVLGLLAQAENDPQAWFIYNYQIGFELAGAPERLMSINTHYELIERIKLVALGVSKSFVSGETSYSSAASGLTVFLQRLKAVRDFFVNEWLIPKYFLPVARINGWIKPSAASKSSGGHIRIKQSAKDMSDERLFIIPTIEWSKSLDPTVDKERIDAMSSLEQNLGIRISDQRKYAAMGLDAEEEQTKIVEEIKRKRDLAGQDPLLQAALGLAAPPEGGGGGAGALGDSVMSPGIPPEAMGMPGGEGGEAGDMNGGAPPAGGEAISGAGGESNEAKPADKPSPAEKPVQTYWAKKTLEPIINLFKEWDLEPLQDAEPWVNVLKDPDFQRAVKAQDPQELWLALESWLVEENYPSKAIKDLQDSLSDIGTGRKAQEIDPKEFKALMAQLGVDAPEDDESFDSFVWREQVRQVEIVPHRLSGSTVTREPPFIRVMSFRKTGDSQNLGFVSVPKDASVATEPNVPSEKVADLLRGRTLTPEDIESMRRLLEEQTRFGK